MAIDPYEITFKKGEKIQKQKFLKHDIFHKTLPEAQRTQKFTP